MVGLDSTSEVCNAVLVLDLGVGTGDGDVELVLGGHDVKEPTHLLHSEPPPIHPLPVLIVLAVVAPGVLDRVESKPTLSPELKNDR